MSILLANNITKLIGEAMKAHDEVRLSTLRMLSSALNYELIAKQHPLSADEEIAVVKKEAKKRKDAIEAYTKANAQERAEKEAAELKILQEYLPEEMPEAEVVKLVKEAMAETGAKSMADMGKVIGIVVQKSAGRADGSLVAKHVKDLLLQSV